MLAHRVALFLAGLALSAAGSAVPEARADTAKDELAEGDWRGRKDWQHLDRSGGGDGSGSMTSAPSTPPPPPSGTPTPAPNDPDDEPGDEPEGDPAGDPEGDPSGEPGSEPDDPTQPPPTTPPTLSTAFPACAAHWVCEEIQATPAVYEKETLLTLTLFRTDAFAFVCNGYCRAESTWYVDLVASTAAQHDGSGSYDVIVRLENPCPYCKPEITLHGVSALDTRVQVKTQWGGLDASTTASASASTQWAGDIDCSDACSCSITNVKGGGQMGVGFGGFKFTSDGTKSYGYVSAPGGRPAWKTILRPRAELLIVDRGGVATYAGGCEDNAQAKCRAAYRLKIRGDSACGPWGEYTLEIRE